MSETEDMDHARIDKRVSGNFTLEDIDDFLRKKAKPGAKVYPLKLGQWVKIGNRQLLLRSISGDMDDAWIRVVTKNHHRWLNWLILPIASYSAKDELVVWWRKIPCTNLMLDILCLGDGSDGVPLVFEAVD